MSQTTTNATVAQIPTVSDNIEQRLRDAYKALHHAVGLALTETKQEQPKDKQFPTDFAKCGPEDYKNLHLIGNGMLRAKDAAREAARVAPLVQGIQRLRDTYNAAQRKEKAEYDAIPAAHRKFLAPFPTTFTVPAAEVAKVWPQGAQPTDITRDLASSELKKAVSYTMTKDGGLSFPFVPAPTPVAAPAAKVA